MKKSELKQLIREVVEEIQSGEKKIEGWPELVYILFLRGMRDDMTEQEFIKQVKDNALEYGRVVYPNDPAKAKRQANYKLSYDEDHWSEAYWHFNDKFGHSPKK